MQGLAFPSRKGRFTPATLLVLLLLLLLLLLPRLPLANGTCEFPASWAGEWFDPHHTPQSVVINATTFAGKTCIESKNDKYITYAHDEQCYECLVIVAKHENAILYRESWCLSDLMSDLEDMCDKMESDAPQNSMFRQDAKPIPCPFNGPPFTFSYNRGHGECSEPASLAERCTDESKLLLKYQSCPYVKATESTTEELQCLALWSEDRTRKYLVGTISERGTEKKYRCFLYEEKPHHEGKVVYVVAQSGDPTCTGLTNIAEGSPIINLMRVDKEHSRCKYPSWVTEHHDWHSLDGTRVYHFTNKNATLKVKAQESDGDAIHEERIVCHNLEELNDTMQGHKVKLVAHVTSGCDIGYVCMIFRRRDGHVIELQQSSQKTIMPYDACRSISDPSSMPYTTLVASSLHQRKCLHPGRYTILDFAPKHVLSDHGRRHRRDDSAMKTTERRTWQDDTEEKECKTTDIQIGCSSSDQHEMIIANTCEHEQVAYTCHGSWEENGTWYTIVSRKTTELTVGATQTFCFTAWINENDDKVSGKIGRARQPEQELWLSQPTHACQRNTTDQWTYKLVSQGVCEDLTKAASSSTSSTSLPRFLFVFIAVIFTLLISRPR